jgi:hypothetical protein
MDESFSETSLLRHLEDLAARLEVEIRYENLADEEVAIHSGACRVSGRNFIMVDLQLPPLERARVLARELSRYDLESVYLLPRVRDFIALQGSPREKNLPQR